MPPRPRLVTAGRVGRPHGLDGSFYVEAANHELFPGTVLNLGGVEREVERRAGTEERPLVRLSGITDRDAAAALRGELLLISEDHSPLEEGEWLAGDLEGCVIPGFGTVSRVLGAPSCDLLELDDGTLVPLISDAVRSIDVERGRIDINPDFLGEKAEEA
jgi:16S rRNA processing protein RimM